MSDDTSSSIPGLPAHAQQPPADVPPLPWEPTEQSAWPQESSPQESAPPQSAPPQSAPPPQSSWQQPSAPDGWSPTESFALQPGFQQPGYQQPAPPVPPSAPPPPGAGRRRRPPLWTLIVGGVALIGLVVGLLIWAPWSPPPQAPTALHVSSPTATTALVSWTAPKGGAKPSQYDIMRDGREQGIVPGTQTSWTDTGLAPGSKHSYVVITEGNGQKSGPSATVSVRTITPSPVDVTETGKTYTTVTLHWSPPPNAPTPDSYEVYDTSTGKDLMKTLLGSQTSYTVTQLVPGNDYSFAVGASWGSVDSAAATVEAPPLSPPLSGSVGVNVKVTQILPLSHGITDGETWTDNWNFTANCPATSCTLTNNGSLVSSVGTFTMKMKPANGGYRGQASHVQFSHCNGADSYETVTIQINPNSGGVSNGAWTSWHGTMVLAYPGQTEGQYYCTAGDWDLSLSGGTAVTTTT